MNGTIIRGMGGLYTVRDKNGQEYVLRAKKKFRRMHISPLVGDEIIFTKGEISDEHGWVEEILPRKSVCLRPPVANATLIAIIIAPEPETDFLLVDKLLMYAQKQALRTAIIINKADLCASLYQQVTREYHGAQTDVFEVSAKDGRGTKALLQFLKGETICFCGQSGVGKSTLLNTLLGLEVQTGEISKKIQRGKNTTRHAELFESHGARVLDTPGFSLLEIKEGLEPVKLQEYYPEFAPYLGACRFKPCYHNTEPGCAVLAAVKAGEISNERVARYHQLLATVKQSWRERYD